jgi:hypothetical protein
MSYYFFGLKARIISTQGSALDNCAPVIGALKGQLNHSTNNFRRNQFHIERFCFHPKALPLG